MTTRVGRNDPCPCGSGLKYKQCCAGKMRVNVRGPRGWMLGALALGVVGLVAWGLVRAQTRPVLPAGAGQPLSSAPTTPGTASSPGPVTSTQQITVNPTSAPGAPMTTTTGSAVVNPQAWAYDPVTNRHFDPGHGHWHDGPAPPPGARGASTPPSPAAGGTAPTGTSSMHSDATPAPWTYDAQKNQHWDPGHGHWHQGPPPAGAK